MLLDQDQEYTPAIKVFSEGKKLKHCYCTKVSDNMVQCDDCQIWYHFNCVDDYDPDVKQEHYTCIKCREWYNHLNSNLLDIILKRKSYEELLNEDKTYWKGFDSLCNFMEDSDLAL